MINNHLYERFNGNESQKVLDSKVVHGIIEWFENIKTRPEMFFGEINAMLVENGLYWFHMSFVHLNYNFQPQKSILAAHKLNKGSAGIAHQLKERGMSEADIVNEILDLEIEIWKQLLKEIENA